MRAYTGIGSRETPDEILTLMRNLAYDLAVKGWTLRSGCAPGADSAFEEGAWDATLLRGSVPRPELYLPWPKFECRRSVLTMLDEPQSEALEEAAKFHPRWPDLSQGAQKLHGRNVHQVLGPDVLNYVLSEFVMCWTPGAKGGGGTGQAIRIAKAYSVPVYDLADASMCERVIQKIWG